MKSIRSLGNGFKVVSNFLNRFFKISESECPALIEFDMTSFVANISFSSTDVGSPIYSQITLTRALESVTLKSVDLLLRYPRTNFNKTTPADQISIFVS